MKEQDCQQQLNRRLERHSKWKKTTRHKTRHWIACFSQLVSCWQAQVVFFPFTVSLWEGCGGGGRQEGCLFLEGPPRVLWLRSAAAAAPRVRQRRTASKRNGHTQKSAQLCCTCAWLEGGMGGGSGWFCGVGEERMGGFGGRRREGKKDTHHEWKKTNAQWKRRNISSSTKQDLR